MKDYNQLATELLERRDIFEAEKKRNRKTVTGVGVSVLCIVAVAVGVGIFNNADNIKLQLNKISGKMQPDEVTLENSMIYDKDGSDITSVDYKQIIVGGQTGSGACCYATPDNGTSIYSMEVRSVIEEPEKNKNTYLMVWIDIFKNHKRLENAETVKEFKRLSSLGYEFYTVPVREYPGENGEQAYHNTTVAIIPFDKIISFDINPEYGYFVDFITNHNGTPIDINDAEKISF